MFVGQKCEPGAQATGEGFGHRKSLPPVRAPCPKKRLKHLGKQHFEPVSGEDGNPGPNLTRKRKRTLEKILDLVFPGGYESFLWKTSTLRSKQSSARPSPRRPTSTSTTSPTLLAGSRTPPRRSTEPPTELHTHLPRSRRSQPRRL